MNIACFFSHLSLQLTEIVFLTFLGVLIAITIPLVSSQAYLEERYRAGLFEIYKVFGFSPKRLFICSTTIFFAILLSVLFNKIINVHPILKTYAIFIFLIMVIYLIVSYGKALFSMLNVSSNDVYAKRLKKIINRRLEHTLSKKGCYFRKLTNCVSYHAISLDFMHHQLLYTERYRVEKMDNEIWVSLENDLLKYFVEVVFKVFSENTIKEELYFKKNFIPFLANYLKLCVYASKHFSTQSYDYFSGNVVDFIRYKLFNLFDKFEDKSEIFSRVIKEFLSVSIEQTKVGIEANKILATNPLLRFQSAMTLSQDLIGQNYQFMLISLKDLIKNPDIFVSYHKNIAGSIINIEITYGINSGFLLSKYLTNKKAILNLLEDESKQRNIAEQGEINTVNFRDYLLNKYNFFCQQEILMAMLAYLTKSHKWRYCFLFLEARSSVNEPARLINQSVLPNDFVDFARLDFFSHPNFSFAFNLKVFPVDFKNALGVFVLYQALGNLKKGQSLPSAVNLDSMSISEMQSAVKNLEGAKKLIEMDEWKEEFKTCFTVNQDDINIIHENTVSSINGNIKNLMNEVEKRPYDSPIDTDKYENYKTGKIEFENNIIRQQRFPLYDSIEWVDDIDEDKIPSCVFSEDRAWLVSNDNSNNFFIMSGFNMLEHLHNAVSFNYINTKGKLISALNLERLESEIKEQEIIKASLFITWEDRESLSNQLSQDIYTSISLNNGELLNVYFIPGGIAPLTGRYWLHDGNTEIFKARSDDPENNKVTITFPSYNDISKEKTKQIEINAKYYIQAIDKDIWEKVGKTYQVNIV